MFSKFSVCCIYLHLRQIVICIVYNDILYVLLVQSWVDRYLIIDILFSLNMYFVLLTSHDYMVIINAYKSLRRKSKQYHFVKG